MQVFARKGNKIGPVAIFVNAVGFCPFGSQIKNSLEVSLSQSRDKQDKPSDHPRTYPAPPAPKRKPKGGGDPLK